MGATSRGDHKRLGAKGGAAALLAGVVAIAYTSLYFDRGIDAFDAGLYAAEAARILDGGAYGRDFVAPYGPGMYYLIAGLFAMFGACLKVQAALFLVVRGCVAALMYVVSRRVIGGAWPLIFVAAVTAAHGALHKSFFQLVVLLGPAAYFFYRRAPGLRRCIVAGVLLGAGALFRVDAGLFGGVAFFALLALELVWDRPAATLGSFGKKAGGFLLGAALPVAPVTAAVAAAGDIEWVLAAEVQRVANLARFAAEIDVPGVAASLAAGSPKLALLGIMIPAAPIALLVLAATVLVSRLRGDMAKGGLEPLAIAAFGLPVMNQVRITPTFNHLLQAAPLALLAATLVLHRFLVRPPPVPGAPGRGSILAAKGVRWAGAASAALPGLMLVLYTLLWTRPDSVLPGSIRNRWAFDTEVALERAGVFETAATASELDTVVAAVRARSAPGEALFVAPYAPALYFLAERPPAVPFLEPFYYFDSAALQGRMIEALKTRPPPAIVLGGPVGEVGGQSLSRDAPLLHGYLMTRYTPLQTLGSYTIWIRKEGT